MDASSSDAGAPPETFAPLPIQLTLRALLLLGVGGLVGGAAMRFELRWALMTLGALALPWLLLLLHPENSPLRAWISRNRALRWGRMVEGVAGASERRWGHHRYPVKLSDGRTLLLHLYGSPPPAEGTRLRLLQSPAVPEAVLVELGAQLRLEHRAQAPHNRWLLALGYAAWLGFVFGFARWIV